MKWLALVALIALTSSGAAAQDLGLVIVKGKLDLNSNTYTFDLLNTSETTILSWTLQIAHGERMTQLYVASYCWLGLPPLRAGESRSCKLEVNRWNVPQDAPEVPVITSVLFADGRAAGDLAILDGTIESLWNRYDESQYWLERLRESKTSPDLVAAMKAIMERARTSAPDLPQHDSYSKEAIEVRGEIAGSLSDAIKKSVEKQFSASQLFEGLLQPLEARQSIAAAEAKLFPRSAHRYSEANIFLRSLRELQNESQLTIVRFEENVRTLRIVVRNGTAQPIEEWGFKAVSSHGDVVKVEKGSGNPLLQPGSADVLELSRPSDAHHIVVVQSKP